MVGESLSPERRRRRFASSVGNMGEPRFDAPAAVGRNALRRVDAFFRVVRLVGIDRPARAPSVELKLVATRDRDLSRRGNCVDPPLEDLLPCGGGVVKKRASFFFVRTFADTLRPGLRGLDPTPLRRVVVSRR